MPEFEAHEGGEGDGGGEEANPHEHRHLQDEDERGEHSHKLGVETVLEILEEKWIYFNLNGKFAIIFICKLSMICQVLDSFEIVFAMR